MIWSLRMENENHITIKIRFKIQGVHALEQSFEVSLQEQYRALLYAQPFPNAVTENKTGIKNRHPGLSTREMRAIDIDQDIVVTRVMRVIVCSLHSVLRSPWLDCEARQLFCMSNASGSPSGTLLRNGELTHLSNKRF